MLFYKGVPLPRAKESLLTGYYFQCYIIFIFVFSSILHVHQPVVNLYLCSTISCKMYFNWYSFGILYSCKTTRIKI